MARRKRKYRIEVIDVAKCLAIFMVILGHTATNDELLGNPPMLVKVLYSIHMPLFFFLSGMSLSLKPLNTRNEWALFLRKTVLTLAIPYFLWALIYCNFNFKNVLWIVYGSWAALGKTGTVTSLWYLSCFFVARILVQIIISIMDRAGLGKERLAYFIPAVICLVVSILFPDIEIGYPWCLNVAFAATGCILLGIALRKVIIELSVQHEWILIALLCVSIALFSVTAYVRGDNFGVMMMCRGAYGNPLFALIFAVLGGFAVLLISMLLKRVADEWISDFSIKGLVYLGQHTLGVFLLHKPMLQSIFLPLFGKLLGSGPDILVRLLATNAALFVSLWFCLQIEYYIPELVGIFGKDRILGPQKENAN